MYITLVLFLGEGRRGGMWWDFNTINCTLPYCTVKRLAENTGT
jgi:hypothetical protein